MKTCKKCGESKDESEFYFHHSNKDRLRTECKKCWSKYKKLWYEENKEECIANARQRYYKAKAEVFGEMMKSWKVNEEKI